jgi:glutaredoxin
MIEIWGKDGCGYCDAAKNLCEMRSYKVQYYKLDRDFTRDELFEMFPDAKTFPQIKVAGKHVGGYSEFTRYLEETGYNGTGHTL